MPAVRTRYKRGSSSAYGYGGAWLKAWFGGADVSQSAGNSGNAYPIANYPPASQQAAAGYTQLQGFYYMGGTVVGQSADGRYLIGHMGGKQFMFDSKTGAQVGPAEGTPIAGTTPAGTGAAGTGAGAAAGTGAGGTPVGGGAATGGGATTTPTSRVGQTVSAVTSSGQTVSGTITAEANGITTVKWADGTVATYGADGALVSSTPPGAGAGAGAGAAPGAGATTPGGATSLPGTSTSGETMPTGGTDQYAAPTGQAGETPVGGTGTYVPIPPDQLPPPVSYPGEPGGPPPATTAPADTTAAPASPYVPPAPVDAGGGNYLTPGDVTAPATAAPAPAEPPPGASPFTPPGFGEPAGSTVYTAPSAPPPAADPYAGMISTQYGWLTPDQLMAVYAAPSAPVAPPPAPPPSPADNFLPPPSAYTGYNPNGPSIDPGYTDPSYYAPPQPLPGQRPGTPF